MRASDQHDIILFIEIIVFRNNATRILYPIYQELFQDLFL
jgi:hypothetical protein